MAGPGPWRAKVDGWHGGGVSADVPLDLKVPGGRDVWMRTLWTPPTGEPLGWAWVQHGFARGARHLGGLARLLAAHGIAVVRPQIASLRPWHSLHDRVFLTAAALTIARALEVGIPQRAGVEVGPSWWGIGHSAGAGVVAHAAGVLGHRGKAGSPRALILLDPVDSVGGLLSGALPSCEGMWMQVAALTPSRCNRHGAMVDELRRRPATAVATFSALSHADPERIPAVLDQAAVPPPTRAAALACGRPGPAEEVVALARRVVTSATSSA